MKCNNMWLYALQKNPQELKFFVLWKDYNYDILKENDKFEVVEANFMEYGIISLMIIGGILFYIKINELQKQVKAQQVQLDKLCKETGNQQLATYFISDEEKEYIAHLKNSGKEVEAVKKVREITSMDLVQAKQYVDTL